MRGLISKVALLLIAGFAMPHATALAQTKSPPIALLPIAPDFPTDPDELKKQIDAFDPRAVKAANDYWSQPIFRSELLQVTQDLYQQVVTVVERQNPNLDAAKMAKVETTVGDPMRRRLDLLVQMSVLAALKTFSTDELVALDKFYSSPEGKAIQSKTPKMMAQVPVILKEIMPAYLDEIKTKLKADKVEVEF